MHHILCFYLADTPMVSVGTSYLCATKAIVKSLAIQEDEVSPALGAERFFRCHGNTRYSFKSNGFHNSNW